MLRIDPLILIFLNDITDIFVAEVVPPPQVPIPQGPPPQPQGPQPQGPDAPRPHSPEGHPCREMNPVPGMSLFLQVNMHPSVGNILVIRVVFLK